MKRIKLLIIAALVMLTSFTVKAQEMSLEQMMPVRVLMPVNK